MTVYAVTSLKLPPTMAAALAAHDVVLVEGEGVVYFAQAGTMKKLMSTVVLVSLIAGYVAASPTDVSADKELKAVYKTLYGAASSLMVELGPATDKTLINLSKDSSAAQAAPTPDEPLIPPGYTAKIKVKEVSAKAKAPKPLGPGETYTGKWQQPPVQAIANPALGKAPQVKLADATAMYQMVHGTSTGSKYYVVALAQGLKVAARYGGASLSVRAEGENLAIMANVLKIAGLDTKGDYASMHFQVAGDDMLAQKTLGAVLAVIGSEAPYTTPVPSIKVLKGG